MEGHSKWTVIKNGMPFKREFHSKWNVLKMEYHSKWNVTQNDMSLTLECHSN